MTAGVGVKDDRVSTSTNAEEHAGGDGASRVQPSVAQTSSVQWSRSGGGGGVCGGWWWWGRWDENR